MMLWRTADVNRESRRVTGARLAGMACMIVATACAPVHHFFAWRLRPQTLVGNWSANVNASDTVFWQLFNGRRRSVRTVRVTENSRTSTSRRSVRVYADRWYVVGDLADSASRQLCFSQRPGRFGSSCAHFWLDSVDVNGASRRRLIVAVRSTGERRFVLLEQVQ